MARPTKSTSRRVGPIATLAALALLLLPATALANAAAFDEYSLGAVGGHGAGRTDPQQPSAGDDAPAPDQLGVVGENTAAESPLEIAGTSTDTAGWLGLAALVIVAGVALAWNRPRGSRR